MGNRAGSNPVIPTILKILYLVPNYFLMSSYLYLKVGIVIQITQSITREGKSGITTLTSIDEIG
jgi:hypothetical protein